MYNGAKRTGVIILVAAQINIKYVRMLKVLMIANRIKQ